MKAITAPKRFATISAVCLSLLVLAACTTPTPYETVAENDYGYSEQKVEDNRYRVTFAGNSATKRETVENYLLYRAAELTVANGFTYFHIANQNTDKSTNYQSSGPSVGVFGGRSRGGFGWRIGSDFDLRENESRYTAIAMILMHRGNKPADAPNAYDADTVLTNLGPKITLPKE